MFDVDLRAQQVEIVFFLSHYFFDFEFSAFQNRPFSTAGAVIWDFVLGKFFDLA